MPLATTADQFLDLLRKSQLVPPERLDEALRSAPADLADQPKKLAEHFVQSGLLTPFQASLILNGKWRGFQIAGGKYKLLQLLGVGGMGKVYLCEHVRMKRLVALKILPADQLKDAGAIERFNREAVAAAALNHPNIVKAFDIDQDGAMHFLVMEYVDGSSLHEIVKKHGPLDIPRACHYIAQSALGLQHAHEAGWIHRDIKPGNLLLDRAGTVKILDMGLARFFSASASAGPPLTQQLGGSAVLGTADYLSPEQAVNSSDVDIRSDIYSLGATLYFLLGGRSPFEAGTVTEKLLAHQLKEPEAITRLRPETPPGLQTILKKMMAKKPVHRYQTPMAVVEALAPWTAVPIEPPANEEMPRLSAALESYASGVPVGPISGISHPGSGRYVTPGTASYSSGYLLRNGTPNVSWLSDNSKMIWWVGGGAAVVVFFAVLGLLWAFASNKSSHAPPVAGGKPLPNLATKVPSPSPQPQPKDNPPAAGGAITVAEAVQQVGKKVTVEFVVHSTGASRDGSLIFLNSSDRRDKDNFTVVLEAKKLEGTFSEAGIKDPKEYYRSKTLRVTGTVSLYKDSKQILVNDMKQIETVGS